MNTRPVCDKHGVALYEGMPGVLYCAQCKGEEIALASMLPDNTPTPEMDAFERNVIACIPEDLHQLQAYARKGRELETRLAAAEAEVARLRGAEPKMWDAETIKDAPEGRYLGHFISWGVVRTKAEWTSFGRMRGVTFFGPLPTPPMKEGE